MRPSTLPKPVTTPSAGGLVAPVRARGEPHLRAVRRRSRRRRRRRRARPGARARSSSRGRAASRPCPRRPSRAPSRGALRGPRPAHASSASMLLASRFSPSTSARASRGRPSALRARRRCARHSARRSAEHRQRRVEIQIVLRREGAQPEPHVVGLFSRAPSTSFFTSASSSPGRDRARSRGRAARPPPRRASRPSSIISRSRRRGTWRARTAMIIIGKRPTSNLRRPELRLARRDRERARRDEPEPAAQRVPVHLRDDRLVACASARGGGRRSRPCAAAPRPRLPRRVISGNRRPRRTPSPRRSARSTRTSSRSARVVERPEQLVRHLRPDRVPSLGRVDSVIVSTPRVARDPDLGVGLRIYALASASAGCGLIASSCRISAPARPSPACAPRRAPCAPRPRRARRSTSPSSPFGR